MLAGAGVVELALVIVENKFAGAGVEAAAAGLVVNGLKGAGPTLFAALGVKELAADTAVFGAEGVGEAGIDRLPNGLKRGVSSAEFSFGTIDRGFLIDLGVVDAAGLSKMFLIKADVLDAPLLLLPPLVDVLPRALSVSNSSLVN